MQDHLSVQCDDLLEPLGVTVAIPGYYALFIRDPDGSTV